MYKVSVIIPIYNAEDYLPACLDSAVNQTLEDIEIICIDDGSSDNSAAIAAEYARRYDNIRLIRQENSGPSMARNAGLDIAAGEYIFFLDSDDAINSRTLECLYEKAAGEQLDVLYFNARVVYENAQLEEAHADLVAYYHRPNVYSGICTGQTMFARMRRDRKFLPAACLQLFRRAFLEENGIRFYPRILHEDNLFTFRCAMTAQRANYVPDAFYLRRMRPDSIMTSPKSIRHVEGYLVCYREALLFLHDIAVQEDAAAAVENFLERSILLNACRIFRQLPEEEKRKLMAQYGIGASHLLNMGCRLLEQAEKNKHLQDCNALQSKQLKTADAQLARLRKCNPIHYIKGFFRTVKEQGLGGALRKTAVKVSRAFAALMSRCTWGSWKDYFVLARKNGYRTARRELAAKKLQAKRKEEVRKLMKEGGKTPLVSFIVPVYNAALYLEQALDCLTGQTMKHIEIICVDDGSTDSSPEILARYAAKDPRVRVLTQKNQFAGAARNHGLREAKGEYVVFLDADDFFEKTLAEDAYLAAKPDNVDVLIFRAMHYNNITEQVEAVPWLLNTRVLPKKQVFNRNDLPDKLFQITTPSPWTKMFRRQFLLDTGLQFPRLRNSEDAPFVLCALALAERITVLDKVLVYYRINVSTSLEATKSATVMHFYDAYAMLLGKLKELGLMEQLRRSYVSIVLSGCLYNRDTHKSPEGRQAVEEALRRYIFRELELTGYEPSYYYVQKHYNDMQAILSGGKEE